MYTHETGDMWTAYDHTDHFIITTNAIVKRDGALVMGAGIARQARDKFPGLDRAFGKAIRRKGRTYHLLFGKKMAAFQVKHHFKDQASLELIQGSANLLAEVAEYHDQRRFDLNFPGIGNGKLKLSDVEPLLHVLPTNVHVWTFK